MRVIQKSWVVHSFRVGLAPYLEFKVGDTFFCPSGFCLIYRLDGSTSHLEIAPNLKKVLGVSNFSYVSDAGSAWCVLE